MPEETPPINPADYPSVPLAYDIAVTAYEMAHRQWDSVHQRIDVSLSFVTTVSIATPVAAEAVLAKPEFDSPLLLAAGALYVLIVVIALVARSFGSIAQISPRELHEQWLHLGVHEFRQRAIYWSGKHNDAARTLTGRKHLAANVMALFFVGEALLLIAWIATAG